ncbi:MAG: hypothetical protein IKB34_08650, partial [Clostridia bacterium]|nr:hypothetical protein [Clostridia bacterium]
MRRFYKTAAVAVLILILPLVFLAACEMIPQTQTTPCDQNGHQWSEGAVTAKPTCVVEGETLYTCTVEGCRGTKIEKIPALGHVADPDLTGKPVAPSCIEGGYLPQV